MIRRLRFLWFAVPLLCIAHLMIRAPMLTPLIEPDLSCDFLSRCRCPVDYHWINPLCPPAILHWIFDVKRK